MRGILPCAELVQGDLHHIKIKNYVLLTVIFEQAYTEILPSQN